MRHARWAWLLFLGNLLDAALTVFGLAQWGGVTVEWNPLMAWCLRAGTLPFVGVKTLVGAGIAWFGWRKRSTVLVFGVVALASVTAWNLGVLLFLTLNAP